LLHRLSPLEQGWNGSDHSPLHIINLNLARNFHCHRVAVAVFGFATGWHAYPAFGDAIFLHIGFFLAAEADAKLAGQHVFAEMWAFVYLSISGKLNRSCDRTML